MPGTKKAEKPRRQQFQNILDKAKKEYRLSEEDADLDRFTSPPIKTVKDLILVIGARNLDFEKFRSRNKKMYDVLRSTLTPIEKVGEVISGAAEEVFAPSQHIFSAVMYLVNAARGVSEAYDTIEGLMEQLSFFTRRLNIYVNSDLTPDTLDLLAQIMVNLFEVLIIATQEIRKGRLKAFFVSLTGGNEAIQDAVTRLETLFGAERGQIIAEINKNLGHLQDTVDQNHQETSQALEEIRKGQSRVLEELSRLEETIQGSDDSLHGDQLRLILKPSPYSEDYYTTFVNTMTKGTGSWIMDDTALASWICSDFPFLHLYGGPGVGKSYLTAFLVKNLGKLFGESGDKMGHNSLGYFFFRNNNPETRSVHQALCDIAAQLSDDDVYYGKILLRNLTSSDDIKTISSAFRKLIIEPVNKDPRQRKIFLLLDGLDEAPWKEVRELLHSMRQIDHNSNIQILLTSRPELQEPIAQTLDEGDGIWEKLHYIHITPARNRADVEAFIEDNVQRARNLRKMGGVIRKKVVQQITAKAGGVFIMAALMLADLRTKSHPRSILNSLREYPPSVPDLLAKVVIGLSKTLSPEQADDLTEILRWVTCAEETLTLGQVQSILTLKLEYPPYDLENSLRGIYSSFFTLDREDGMTTADLLEWREKRAQARETSPSQDMLADDLDFSSNLDQTDVVFFHASLGEFFRSEASTNISPPDGQKIGFDENEALVHIASTCMRIFIQKGFCNKDSERIRLYAATHWQRHVTKINLKRTPADEKHQLVRLVYEMLTNEAAVNSWTSFRDYKTVFHKHEILEGLQLLLCDQDAVTGFDSSHPEMFSWIIKASKDLHAMLEPMGRMFARAWVGEQSSLPSKMVRKTTAACFSLVRSIAFLNKGYRWRSENEDIKLDLPQKMQVALAWANQKPTWWWHLRVGSTWMTQGNLEKALEHYSHAKNMGGNTIATDARIAVCYQRQGRYNEALELYLKCEALETEQSENDETNSEIAHLNHTWRLFRDRIQAAECFVKLNRIDEAAGYYKKAISTHYDKAKYEAETAYISLMTKYNRFDDILVILKQMDRPDSDPSNPGTRLVHFLIRKATENVVLEWIPRTVCGLEAIVFAKKHFKTARQEARNMEDWAAEFALQLGGAMFNIYSRDYTNSLDTLETMCYLHYRPKGSLPIRTIQTQALKRLAYLYKQLALHSDEYGSDRRAHWTAQLEHLEEKLRNHQNLDVPIQFMGQTHNDATLYLGLLKRKGSCESEAREIFTPLVHENLDILDDDEPQNDGYALDNLARVLMAAGDIKNATALHQSMRPPDSTIIASAVSNEREDNESSVRCEPKLPGIVSPCPFCMQCLKSLDDTKDVAVCQFCLDPFCLECLEKIKKIPVRSLKQDYKGKMNAILVLESSCRSDHDWTIVRPLGRELEAGEIFVDGKIMRIVEWKKMVRQAWPSCEPSF